MTTEATVKITLEFHVLDVEALAEVAERGYRQLWEGRDLGRGEVDFQIEEIRYEPHHALYYLLWGSRAPCFGDWDQYVELVGPAEYGETTDVKEDHDDVS